jgi:crossover junction endodeoxyribonuclease RusA
MIFLTGSPATWAAQRRREHMSETMTIVLPWPDAELSPNGRSHWGKKSSAVSLARHEAYVMALEQREHIGIGEPLTVLLQFTPPDKRRYDLDGLISRCKPYLDGICQALTINDYQFCEIRAVRQADIVPGGRVVITIAEVKE